MEGGLGTSAWNTEVEADKRGITVAEGTRDSVVLQSDLAFRWVVEHDTDGKSRGKLQKKRGKNEEKIRWSWQGEEEEEEEDECPYRDERDEYKGEMLWRGTRLMLLLVRRLH
jgi:hypothetical protein